MDEVHLRRSKYYPGVTDIRPADIKKQKRPVHVCPEICLCVFLFGPHNLSQIKSLAHASWQLIYYISTFNLPFLFQSSALEHCDSSSYKALVSQTPTPYSEACPPHVHGTAWLWSSSRCYPGYLYRFLSLRVTIQLCMSSVFDIDTTVR